MSDNKKSEVESGKLNEADLDAAVGGAIDGTIALSANDATIAPCFKAPGGDAGILPCFKTSRTIVPCVKSAARAP